MSFRPPDPAAAPEFLGTRLTEEGVQFRVWAPHADSVHLAGSFNDWADPGIPLQKEDGHWSAHCTEAKPGDSYKFRISHAGQSFLKIDPRARLIDSKTGGGVIYADDFDWGDGSFEPPALNELVLYELHVGTFTKAGNFHGAIEKLPELAELGINGIELMPVAEFPGERSWGYNTTHPFAVAAAYGGATGLKMLIRRAHELGIAVLLDVVYNHLGPDELDLWRFDGWTEGDRGGIYFYNDERAATPWGDTRPDFGRDEVRQYFRDNALMWINEFRADGLRIDGVSHLRTTRGPGREGTEFLPDGWKLMQWINHDLKQRSSKILSIAEGHGHAEELTRWVDEGGAGFDAQWEPNYSRMVRPVLEAPWDSDRDSGAIVSALAAGITDPFRRVIYIEAHDEVGNGKNRLAAGIDRGHPDSIWVRRRCLQAAGILLTSPGLPLLFQGQEYLEADSFDDGHTFDWEKASRFGQIRHAFRDLIRLRRNLDGTTLGLQGPHLEILQEGGPVLAWHRWQNGGPRDSSISVVNLTAETLDDWQLPFPAAGSWQVRFNADWKGYSDDFGNAPLSSAEATPQDGERPQVRLQLPPYAFVVLSQA